VAAGIHRIRDGIFLPRRSLFAALDQVFRALAQFTRFALRELLAFTGPLAQVFARLFTGLRSEEDPHERPDSQTHQKEAHFRSRVIGHVSILLMEANIPTILMQGTRRE